MSNETPKRNSPGHARAGEEIENLLGQFHARTLLYRLGHVVVHLLLINATLVVVFFVSRALLTIPECVSGCLLRGGLECCISASFVALVVALLCVVMIGSLLSSRLVASRKFQFSGILTALMLLVTLCYLVSTPLSASLIAMILVAQFFAMYTGYRLSFRL